MNRYELDYKRLLNDVKYHGADNDSRNGAVIMAFGTDIMIDLDQGFPILTGKKMNFDMIHAEFRWMWLGKTDLKSLHINGIHYWDDFVNSDGELGPTYGAQLRYWNQSSIGLLNCVDQLDSAAYEIMKNSRRAVVTFWNPTDVPNIPLPPCYTVMTFVRDGNRLNLELNIRSSDMLVGLPFDVGIAALFLIEMATTCKLKPRFLKLNLANAHIHVNNAMAMEEYLASKIHDLPIYDGTRHLIGYKHEKFIKMKLNV